jgi:hypothetical protein
MAETAHRAARRTAPRDNRRIAEATARRLAAYRSGDRDRLIEERLHQLEKEWDIERLLQTNFAAISLLAVLLGGRDRRSLMLATLVPVFMAQHALQGWCPPLPLFRKMGFRTRREIDDERFALQALRGDFDGPASRADAYQVMDAVRH